MKSFPTIPPNTPVSFLRSRNKLFDLFEKYQSDKHHLGYHEWYQKYLPKEAGDFLEIGTWKGGGIKAFKEFYKNEGRFYAMNYIFGGEIISVGELAMEGIQSYECNQSDIPFLQTITQQFDVIIDDGSHHSDEQIITFKQMFLNNLKPGGVYIIEDLHCCKQAYWWRIIEGFKNTMLGVVKTVLSKGTFVSQLFTKEESDYFADLITDIKLPSDSIVFIWKGDNTKNFNKWRVNKLKKYADTI